MDETAASFSSPGMALWLSFRIGSVLKPLDGSRLRYVTDGSDSPPSGGVVRTADFGAKRWGDLAFQRQKRRVK